MNLPSSTSNSANTTSNPPEICENCRSQDSWIIHPARYRSIFTFFCTHCLLRKHPASFCPTCFSFYDSSPPHHSRRVSCSDCGSHTHIHCAGGEAVSPPYRCPPCRDPDSFSFFRPIIDANGVRCVDKSLSEVFLCAAKISAASMSKAVNFAKCEAERRGREAAVAKMRAREALVDVLKLDEKAKLDRDQKPNVSHASTNSVQVKKQNTLVQLDRVKQEH
ncbi:unnamed protein product [Eruca vesicaria subsp. sativa]|uniref:Uncharacterized protein n=1 Tax=Eruca vesicaria subsp. sativa TaxID=29727 RepID=A0ABC8LKQ2_ERUVS|nr:unnamed protein product [Eruca vesicaria subsp. sativa]